MAVAAEPVPTETSEPVAVAGPEYRILEARQFADMEKTPSLAMSKLKPSTTVPLATYNLKVSTI